MIFIIHFVNVVNHIDWFTDVESSLHPWNKSHLIMVVILSMYCLVKFSSIWLSIFALMFIMDIDL